MASVASVAHGLQELTRRLQEERDALRTNVDELTKQLGAERSARTATEHELQVRELELLHEQQRARQAKQSLSDKIMQLERELDEEKAMHQMVMMGRNVAADKNATLATEMRELEAKVKKEQAKKETLAAELEQAREELQMLAMERDAIVQRTESDAKRVRALWEQINREHETQAEALRVELEQTQQATAQVNASVTEYQAKIELLEATLLTANEAKKDLEVKIAMSSNEALLFQERLERERDRERDAGQHKSQLELTLHDWRSRCALLEEKEKIAVREKDIALVALEKCERELESRTEELLALKTEFSDLLDKHERFAEEFKQKTREREVHARLRYKKLEQGKRCVEELAVLRKRELTEYKHVIRAVNRRLNDVREKQQDIDANIKISEIRVAPKSLSIFRQ